MPDIAKSNTCTFIHTFTCLVSEPVAQIWWVVCTTNGRWRVAHTFDKKRLVVQIHFLSDVHDY